MSGLRLTNGELHIPAAEIQAEVAAIGGELAARYADVERFRMIACMQGATIFAVDLMRNINHLGLVFDTVRPNSYDGMVSSGEVSFIYEPDTGVEGQHVVIVEDVLDKGYTAEAIGQQLRAQNPASLVLASIFSKPDAQQADYEQYFDEVRIGLKLRASAFVVGYGLDWKGLYRHLPYLTLVKESETQPGFWVPAWSPES